MDYETNIVINRLIEEVGELNSPDWCTIIITSIITIINAGFMAWLGWRQYKLQQRQTKLQEQQILQQEQQTKLQEQQTLQQEYEIYSKLYKLVKRADVEIEHFLDEITSSLGVVPWRRAEDGFLKLKLDYIAQHITDKRCEVIIGSNLLSFIERRNELRKNSNDILAKIRERCKVE